MAINPVHLFARRTVVEHQRQQRLAIQEQMERPAAPRPMFGSSFSDAVNFDDRIGRISREFDAAIAAHNSGIGGGGESSYIPTSGGGGGVAGVLVNGESFMAKSDLDILIQEKGFLFHRGKKILLIDEETGLPSNIAHHPNEAARKRLLDEHRKGAMPKPDGEPKYDLKEDTL